MKVVLDTNVLISALISPHNPPDLILQSWLAGDFVLITSEDQLEEIRRVSRLCASAAISATAPSWTDHQSDAQLGNDCQTPSADF